MGYIIKNKIFKKPETDLINNDDAKNNPHHTPIVVKPLNQQDKLDKNIVTSNQQPSKLFIDNTLALPLGEKNENSGENGSSNQEPSQTADQVEKNPILPTETSEPAQLTNEILTNQQTSQPPESNNENFISTTEISEPNQPTNEILTNQTPSQLLSDNTSPIQLPESAEIYPQAEEFHNIDPINDLQKVNPNTLNKPKDFVETIQKAPWENISNGNSNEFKISQTNITSTNNTVNTNITSTTNTLNKNLQVVHNYNITINIPQENQKKKFPNNHKETSINKQNNRENLTTEKEISQLIQNKIKDEVITKFEKVNENKDDNGHSQQQNIKNKDIYLKKYHELYNFIFNLNLKTKQNIIESQINLNLSTIKSMLVRSVIFFIDKKISYSKNYSPYWIEQKKEIIMKDKTFKEKKTILKKIIENNED